MFADGPSIQADYVILTADPASFFDKRIDVSMPKQLEKYYKNSEFQRFSAYQCAFSCALSELPFSGDIIFEIPLVGRVIDVL